MVKRAGIIAVPTITLLIVLINGNYLLWRLLVLMVFIIGLGFLWVFHQKRGLSGSIKKPGERNQAGRPFDIESIIQNESGFAKPFLKVNLNTRLAMVNNEITINVPSRGSYYCHSQVIYPQRGRYQIGPLVATFSDPFDLVHIHRKLDDPQEMLIYPKIVELPYFSLGPGTNSAAGGKSWLNLGAGEAIFGIREYLPGDGLNHIHWRSTAHTGKIMVKEFDSDMAKKVWVILDLNQDVQAGKGLESTEEYGVTIAASMLKKYTDSACQTGLITQTEEYHQFLPRMGESNLWRLLEVLAVYRATGNVPINWVMAHSRGYFNGNSVVIVITPDLNREVLDSISFIERRGIPVAFILLDASTFGGEPYSPEDISYLMSRSVPTFIIRKGDNLSLSLDAQIRAQLARIHEGRV
jgi:uncharacterized protein (DUF58 family)